MEAKFYEALPIWKKNYREKKNRKWTFCMKKTLSALVVLMLATKSVFGERLSNAIIAENSSDCASGMKARTIIDNRDVVSDIINTIPAYDELVVHKRMV